MGSARLQKMRKKPMAVILYSLPSSLILSFCPSSHVLHSVSFSDSLPTLFSFSLILPFPPCSIILLVSPSSIDTPFLLSTVLFLFLHDFFLSHSHLSSFSLSLPCYFSLYLISRCSLVPSSFPPLLFPIFLFHSSFQAFPPSFPFVLSFSFIPSIFLILFP